MQNQIPYGIFVNGMKPKSTKQYIIEKTAPIFNKKGFTGTYLSDLTEATGLTKGSIYCNFKDKNEVAVEAFRHNLKQLNKKVNNKINKLKRADEKLLVLLNHYKNNYKQVFKNGGCAILNTSVDSDDGNELLKNEAVKALNSWKSTTEKIIIEGIKNGELKPIDPEKYSCKFIALIEGSIMLSKTLNEPLYLIHNIEYLEEEVKSLTIKK